MNSQVKPFAWLHGEIQTPPLSAEARLEAGYLLRKLQKGENVPLPHSRPMAIIGKNCHELRINDENRTWRIIYHIADEAIVILEVFSKKTNQTPKKVINACQRRLNDYYS